MTQIVNSWKQQRGRSSRLGKRVYQSSGVSIYKPNPQTGKLELIKTLARADLRYKDEGL